MKPTLIIICGQIGVGKTTTTKLLSKILNITSISVDQTINKLYEQPSNFGKDTPFNSDELKVCYNAFALIAECLLSNGISLIVDGAFSKKKQRDLLIGVTEKYQVSYNVLNITCPDELIKERASKRFKDNQGVGWEAHLQLKKIYEPLDIESINIDTSKDIEKQLREFFKTN